MRPTILVVENHPDLRREIVATLAREQYECEGVSTGEAALLKIREHDYRYILLDVDLPTAGNALYASCAAEGTLKKLVLISDEDQMDDMPASAAECLVLRKPFDTKQLLARITR